MALHILIADDDRVVTHALASRLKAAGYTSAIAVDAMQTVMLAVKTPPDAILLDIAMPAGSGLQALQRLKSSTKTSEIPVIVISGSTDAGMPKKVLALGAEQYFAKPIDFEALVTALDALTGNTPKP